MLTASVLLAAVAIALAWPVPVALARASWPARAPGPALALWQAIALGGGITMIGSLLVFGAAPAGSLPAAAAALLPHLFAGSLPQGFSLVHLGALTLAIALAVHLALNLALTAGRAERERRRQHQLIALLSDPLPGSPHTRVLPHSAPLAYCVPGIRTATVLTDGLVAALDDRQLAAVVAHERAHLEQFHHVVLVAFRAWHSALPWFPIANRAERAVTQLTEMLADDRARHEAGDDALGSALRLLGSDAEPGAYADAGGIAPDRAMLDARLERLGTDAGNARLRVG
ncbi:M56 family metallopeptidase [Agromyces sp. MMS24-JH15]|uniref:M56 family metallopeptidase n=1 Tax=Agromyces sp. MMS24-JH15 TaxID=3243765 RepID=UPI003748D6FA